MALAFLFESPNKSRWKRLRQQSRPATKAEAGTEDLVVRHVRCVTPGTVAHCVTPGEASEASRGKGVQKAVNEDDTVEATRGAIN
jgi:hypothetical protein